MKYKHTLIFSTLCFLGILFVYYIMLKNSNSTTIKEPDVSPEHKLEKQFQIHNKEERPHPNEKIESVVDDQNGNKGTVFDAVAEKSSPQEVFRLNDSVDNEIIELPLPEEIVLLEKRWKPTLPPVQLRQELGEKEKEVAEKLIDEIDTYLKTIESMEFDFKMTDTHIPLNDMEGHVFSNKRGAFSFKGKIVGNTTHARIQYDYDSDLSYMVVEDKEQAERINKDFSELAAHFWFTPLKTKTIIEQLDTVMVNQKVKVTEDDTRVCTVLSGPLVTLFFESSTGRLLRAKADFPEQKSTSTFEYKGESRYPNKVILYYPYDERTITYEHTELKIQYKDRREN